MCEVSFVPQSHKNNNPWDFSTDKYHPENRELGVIWLLTPSELLSIDPDTEVVSIMGRKTDAQAAALDLETRGGYTAYGVYEDQFKV